MPWGQVSGVRALQRWKDVVAFIQSKAQNFFEAERAGSLRGANLDEVTKALDVKAAVEQNSRWRHEHAEAYSLARDHRYGRRSRRWLFARALRSKLDGAYVEWGGFLKENSVMLPAVDKMPSQDINTLARKPYQEILTK